MDRSVGVFQYVGNEGRKKEKRERKRRDGGRSLRAAQGLHIKFSPRSNWLDWAYKS